MATVLKAAQREFMEQDGKQELFKFCVDFSRERAGISPENLNFDLRKLHPGKYSSVYHFHRYGEELFVILTGSALLRTPRGIQVVESGDLIFFETGETGAHQLYNHSETDCLFLDVRSFIGYDVCEYPDSDKLMLIPSMEIFRKNSGLHYFDGEEAVGEIWQALKERE